jgi:multicomponent Na+:H+ antiporter subunit D
MTPERAIALSMALPLLAAAGVQLTGRWANLRDGLTFLFALATFAVVCTLWGPVTAGERPAMQLLEIIPGQWIAFEVEPLGLLYALVASGLWGVTHLYAIGYMRGHHEGNQTRFFTCFSVAIFAALGIAYSANLLTLFLFYELLTFSTVPLVTHHGTEKSMKAGRVYLGVLLTTSMGLLMVGILWVQAIAGTTDFVQGGILSGKATGGTIALLAGLFFFGTGKAALMPFHRWLPNAMVAPTPVSALLHAVAVVKAGVFTVLKVTVYTFGIDYLTVEGATVWLQYAAAFTLLASSVIALTQDNLKARLAYSTISQLAYIVLAAALATPAAILGGGLHIAMHAMGKITLFFCAGSIIVGAHKNNVSELDGIGHRMPFTMGAFFIGSLAIIGLPPFGGAWSKWFLAMGAIEAGQIQFVAVYMISSLLSIGYLMPVVARAYFRTESAETAAHPHGESPLLVWLPPVLTSVGCLALFFGANRILDLLRPIVEGA